MPDGYLRDSVYFSILQEEWTEVKLRLCAELAGVTVVTKTGLTTATGAGNALTAVDEAIKQVSNLRASLGSFQKNTLDSTIRTLGVGVENLSASESQIRDTNVAQEVVKLTKNQILQQAGTSVLAQANQAPQQVLSLLR